jgi:hypothetical protein
VREQVLAELRARGAPAGFPGRAAAGEALAALSPSEKIAAGIARRTK